MNLHWEDGFSIKVETMGDEVVITANREGLLSLANHLRGLAEEEPGTHLHLDAYNSLEDGSKELVLVKI